MKNLAASFILFFLYISPTTAQALFSRMQYDWGGSDYENTANMIPLPNKQYLFGGTSTSNPSCTKSSICYGYEDMVLFVLEDQGQKVWEKSYGGSAADLLCDVKKVPAGGFILVGGTFSGPSGIKKTPNFGLEDIWLVRVDDAGNLLWEKTFGSSMLERGMKVIPTSDGGFLIAGWVRTVLLSDEDYLVLKTDASGNQLWTKTFAGPLMDELFDMQQMSNGNFLLSGYSNSPAGIDKTAPQIGGTDQWLICISPAGVKLWDKTYGTTADEGDCRITPLRDGNYLIVGNVSGNAGTLRKIDAQGNLIWTQSCPGGLFRMATQAVNGNIYVAGDSYFGITSCKSSALSGGSVDFWITVYDEAGNKIGDMDYGGTGIDKLISDIKVIDRDLWVMGLTTSGISGNKTTPACGGINDAWIIRLGPGINIVPPTPVALCNNTNTFSVEIATLGVYIPGNVFTVQLSDANGSFSSFPNIGSISGTSSTGIAVQIPAGYPTSDNYKLRVVSSLYADTSSGYDLSWLDTPTVFLGNDSALCYGSSRTFTVDAGYAGYLWYDGLGGETRTVNTPGEYWVQVTGNNGCITRDTATIKRINACGFFMPSAFSPNNDGKNEQCRPQLLGRLVKYHFIVFNRWGQKVFDSYDHSNGWDGKINGRPAEPGAYVWSCLYQFSNEEEKHAKGTVLLIR